MFKKQGKVSTLHAGNLGLISAITTWSSGVSVAPRYTRHTVCSPRAELLSSLAPGDIASHLYRDQY